MDKIVGDTELIEKLQGGTKHVEVFDANGKLLGRYLPQDEYERRMVECGFFPEFNEEIRRQALDDLKNGRCVTTEELLEELEEIERTWRKRS